jgi:hypothetical protein
MLNPSLGIIATIPWKYTRGLDPSVPLILTFACFLPALFRLLDFLPTLYPGVDPETFSLSRGRVNNRNYAGGFAGWASRLGESNVTVLFLASLELD